MNEEKMRTRMEATPSWVPSPEPDLERVVGRARRRRVRRVVGTAVTVMLVAAGIGVPLTLLKNVGHGTSHPAASPLGYGIGIRLPSGWDSRAYVAPGIGPWIEMANFSLAAAPASGAAISAVPYEYGGVHGNDQIFVSVFEYPAGNLQPSPSPFTRLTGRLGIPTNSFRSCQGGRAACFREPFSISGRNFYMVGAISTAGAAAPKGAGVQVGTAGRIVPSGLLAQADQVLGSLTVRRRGYTLGTPCRGHQRLQVQIPANAVRIAPPCVAGVVPFQPTAVQFTNRLRTVSGKPAAGVCVKFTMYESALPLSLERPDRVVFQTRAVASAPPGRVILLRVPALPTGLYYFTCSGAWPLVNGIRMALQGTYLVGG